MTLGAMSGMRTSLERASFICTENMAWKTGLRRERISLCAGKEATTSSSSPTEVSSSGSRSESSEMDLRGCPMCPSSPKIDSPCPWPGPATMVTSASARLPNRSTRSSLIERRLGPAEPGTSKEGEQVDCSKAPYMTSSTRMMSLSSTQMPLEEARRCAWDTNLLDPCMPCMPVIWEISEKSFTASDEKCWFFQPFWLSTEMRKEARVA
mmetsp:Transcript_15701/g.34709  ORF Transcript_15701/g.34709 Transcript_15701/m.34709 type:complete len:209 (-) Transcript_15701:381-1007(-)